ncbi:O-antigen ligase family protein [Paractinoplanes maris]|uniref:O-antigen ligase family protein n=1 Tax=Paractinoplanes maris TaxID=1734446 RepID=UPI0020221724|nr:O-antigen ligase family protein [Actinoplanes maris]
MDPLTGVAALIVGLIFAHIFVLTHNRHVLLAQVAMAATCVTREVTILGIQVELSLLVLLLFAPPLASRWWRTTVPRPMKVGALLLLAGHALAVTQSVDPVIAVLGFIRWALVLNWGLAVYATITTGGVAVLRRYGVTVTVLGAVVATIGWLQSAAIYLPQVGPPFADHPDSTFGYYSNYANFIAVSFVIGFGIILESVRIRQPSLLALSLLCVGITLSQVVAAASRGALLLAAVGAAVLVAASVSHPGRLVRRIGGVAAAVATAYFLLPAETVATTLTRFSEDQGGDIVRYSLQDIGLNLARSHPFGLGWGGFREMAASGAIHTMQPLAHVHNLFTQIALDGGWLAAAGFLLLSGYSVLVPLFSKLRGMGAPMHGLFVAALIGQLAQGLNDYFFFETGSLMAFVLVIVVPPLSQLELDVSRRIPSRNSCALVDGHHHSAGRDHCGRHLHVVGYSHLQQ